MTQEKKQQTNLRKILKKLLRKFYNKNKVNIAVIRLSGVIGSVGMWRSGLTLDDLNNEIERAFKTPKLKALVLQINSPGGSPVQSELIYNRIRMLAEEKKIKTYVFAEDAIASGGYWLACAGDEIYCSSSSIVGSIGVISASFGFSDAIKKLGIKRRIYKQGDNKSVLDPFEKEKAEDVKIITQIQKDIHEAFKDIVRQRREGKIDLSNESNIFNGEFWTGKKALELGLIDGIGDMHKIMRDKFGKDINFIKMSKRKSFIQRIFGGLGAKIIDDLASKIQENYYWSRIGM